MNVAVKVDADQAAAEAYATPLAELNPAKVERFRDDTLWPVFKRLRAEDPVHFTPESEFGPYWSITQWDDIMAVDTNHEAFSSTGGIVLTDLQMAAERLRLPGESTKQERLAAGLERQARFDELWEKKRNAPPAMDMISMMAHNPVTRDMSRAEYQGNVVLLIIGGNDTTRNTISGSVYELNRNPDQYDKLRANPELIASMVSESIRYQTPLAHMARTALKDTEVGGKMIKEGDRVAMWYISGNRDESVIDAPNV